jgi:hypothetical protein
MLYLLLGAGSAYTLSGAPGVVSQRSLATRSLGVAMQVNDASSRSVDPDQVVPLEPAWNDPREGEPFGKGDRDDSGYRKAGGVRVAVEAYQPRGISDATFIDAFQTYIETMDEPWHATSRPTRSITKDSLLEGEKNMIPYIQAELDLDAAVRGAKDPKAIKEALDKAVKAGARTGSPSVKTAEKVMGLFETEDEKGAEKAKPKAPKAPGKQGAGWDNFERTIGKTHDNSV